MSRRACTQISSSRSEEVTARKTSNSSGGGLSRNSSVSSERALEPLEQRARRCFLETVALQEACVEPWEFPLTIKSMADEDETLEREISFSEMDYWQK